MTGTEWITKEKKVQQDFLSALEPEATHQITRSEYRTQPDKIKTDKLIKLYNRHYLPKRNKNNSRKFSEQNKPIRQHLKNNRRN